MQNLILFYSLLQYSNFVSKISNINNPYPLLLFEAFPLIHILSMLGSKELWNSHGTDKNRINLQGHAKFLITVTCNVKQ